MFQFAYPIYLWGLVFALVPLLVHLLNRQRPRTLRFPLVRFLFRAQLPREGKNRLQDILLMLARMAIIASVSLLMARPSYIPLQNEIAAGVHKAVFLRDCSASMTGWGNAETAERLAQEALDELEGWKIACLDSAQSVVSENYNISSALPELHPACVAGDFQEGVRRAVQWLEDAEEARLYIVSDFRRSDWASCLHLVPGRVKLLFLDCSSGKQLRNVGVTSVRTDLLPRGRRRVVASLQNYSAVEEQRHVRLEFGGEAVEQTVRLAPMSSQKLSFAVDDAPSLFSAMLRLDEDDYALDDKYEFAIMSTSRPKALMVFSGDDEKSTLSTFFAGRAMGVGVNGADGFDVTLKPVMELVAEDIDGVQAVFLLGCVDDVSEEVLQSLAVKLEAGAALFVTPGLGSDAMMLHRLSQHGLMNARYLGMAETGARAALGLGWIDQEHPVSRMVKDWDGADLYLFAIRRHLRLACDAPSRIVAKSLAGHPLLLEKSIGNGSCYLFAFDFSLDWSAFPLTSSFLPFLRELCNAAVTAEYGVKKAVCGEVLADEKGNSLDTSRPSVKMIGDKPVEICPPLKEASLDCINVEDLRVALRSDKDAGKQASPTGNSLPIWKCCAWMLALLMLCEALLRR